ncbi:hypothetical protein [Candidatus Rhodobacter oscarellae]|nr:hypothetical protein [Candidatus Rhodobacter lobularis]
MRYAFGIAALAALAACSPPVPESGAPARDVSFGDYGDYNSYTVRRESELTGTPPAQPGARIGPSLPPAQTAATTTTGTRVPPDSLPPRQTLVNADIPPETPALGTTTTNAGTTPPDPSQSNRGLSNEQDFDEVANRQSIESDAERLRANREAFQVIEPTAVPTRTGNAGPNIVQYALSSRHPRGQKLYRRGITSQRKHERACFQYVSSDLAQEAFLSAGGPQRDRLGLDPDGDGYACDWDPSRYRG